MTNALLSSLIVAGLAGLSYMAVKHPRVYRGPLLSAVMLIGFGGISLFEVWNTSNTQAARALVELNTCLITGTEAIRSLRVPAIYTWVTFGVISYAILLSRISAWVLHDRKQRKSGHPNDD